MKNISLTKVTFIVITVALGSSIVSAKNAIAGDVITKNIPAIETSAPITTKVLGNTETQTFISLESTAEIEKSASLSTMMKFEELDLDKNNSLNLVEAESNPHLHSSFTKIDMNSDATISRDEFTSYLTK
jgi:hypothetical protein